MAANIYEELYIIKNSVYGSEMRMAIYNALDKISQQSGGGSVQQTTYVLPIRSAFSSTIVEVESDDI